MDFLYKFFDPSLPRLGVGDDLSTKKALDMLLSAGLKPADKQGHVGLRAMDIGCGNGSPTIQLAKHIDGTILAVDNHQPFLYELKRRAEAEDVSEKIRPYLKDMRYLGSDEGFFDLIWSEGALNIMGFCEGLKLCYSLLSPGGFMAASDLSWLQRDPPEECRQYFDDIYPEMVDIDTNLSIIRKCGYKAVGYFIHPEYAWWESYFRPLEERLKLFRKEYSTVSRLLDMSESIRTEIEMYRKYSSYYGNVFYLMQRD